LTGFVGLFGADQEFRSWANFKTEDSEKKGGDFTSRSHFLKGSKLAGERANKNQTKEVDEMKAYRKTFAVLVMVAFSIILSGIGSHSFAQQKAFDQLSEQELYEGAKKEGRVVMYTSSPLRTMQDVVAQFSKDYPGVKAEVQRYVSTAQYEKFLAESQAGKHTADIISISDKPAVLNLIERKHVAKWSPPTEDGFEEPAYKIPMYSWCPWRTDIVIMVNANLVSEKDGEMLREWEGILHPRWKGKISMRATPRGAGYAPFLMFLDEHPERFGMDFMKKLAAQEPTIYPDPVFAAKQVVQGEKEVWFTGWESFGVNQFLKGAKLRWYFPPPTPSYGNCWTAVSAYAPHPHAARLLMNWFLNEKGASNLQKIYHARAALKGSSDSRLVVKESWYKPVETPYVPDPKRWEANMSKIDKIYKELFKD
jgi:ABC-type Fe3+ transport system substrate-binding protein